LFWGFSTARQLSDPPSVRESHGHLFLGDHERAITAARSAMELMPPEGGRRSRALCRWLGLKVTRPTQAILAWEPRGHGQNQQKNSGDTRR
jgi:hypothetical protein